MKSFCPTKFMWGASSIDVALQICPSLLPHLYPSSRTLDSSSPLPQHRESVLCMSGQLGSQENCHIQADLDMERAPSLEIVGPFSLSDYTSSFLPT